MGETYRSGAGSPRLRDAGIRDPAGAGGPGADGATMVAVAYFTAVLARSGRAWRARDVDLDEGGSLEEVGDLLRAVAVDDEPVVALLEREDQWFALFRVDGEEEPRLFVSDYPAASSSGYAELLAAAADVELPEDPAEEPPAAASGQEDEDEEAQPRAVAVAVAPAWAGDADLLDDLGVSGESLRRLVQEHDEAPAAVLADVGDRLGFGDVLEALR
jgi:putative tRNA adenosine deaminase-associated protein